MVEVSWIKPIARRAEGQGSAHLIVKLRTAKTANAALRHGLVIAGKKVFARKLLREPRRCLRCQGIGVGHLAADCKQAQEVCGSCAQNHPTATCTVNESEYRCANCKVTGHAAWDRMCPAFIEATKRRQRANDSNSYRFYPIVDDPASWELVRDLSTFDGDTHLHQKVNPPVVRRQPRSWSEEAEEEALWELSSGGKHTGVATGTNRIPIATARQQHASQNFRGRDNLRQTTLTQDSNGQWTNARSPSRGQGPSRQTSIYFQPNAK